MKLPQLLQELLDPYPRIRGKCVQCGNCCRSLILTWKKSPVTTEEEFKRLLAWDPKTYERFYPDKEQTPGKPLTFSCIHQKGNTCAVHKSRPRLCETYPHRSIFKLGAELEDECGYRIICKGDFEDILDRKIADKGK